MLHSFPLQDPEDQRIYNLLYKEAHLTTEEMGRIYEDNFHYHLKRLKKSNPSGIRLLREFRSAAIAAYRQERDRAIKRDLAAKRLANKQLAAYLASDGEWPRNLCGYAKRCPLLQIIHKEEKKQLQDSWAKNRRRQPLIRARLNMRARFHSFLNGKDLSFKNILGCSLDQLKMHLEDQFQEGMSWDNYGLYGWHIDHIYPLASFDLFDPEQLKAAGHYSNLQPLWAEDNLKKSDSLPEAA